MSQKIYTDLEVKGSVTISTINNATTDTDRFLVSDAGTIKYRTGTEMLSDLGAQSILTNPITGTGTINYVSKFTTSTTLGDSIIYDNGTNIGIGTTSPSSKLGVLIADPTSTISGVSAVTRLMNNGSGYISKIILTDNTISDATISFLPAAAGESTLSFGVQGTTVNYQTLNIKENGNVGIGTIIPSQKLHVAGSIRIDGAVYDSTNSPGTSGQVLTSTVTGNSWSTLSSIGGLPAGGTAGQILTKVDATDYNATWQENYADWTSIVKYVVKNNGSTLITKGTPVYSTGSDGTNILVGKAGNQSEATSSKTMGLMQSDITTTGSTQTGFVISEGLLSGLNTAGQTAGDPVWLGPTGTLIYGLTNKPYAPAHLVFIGIVTKVSAGSGEIFVKVQNGFELEELHNVDLKTTIPITGHILGFDGTLWVNKTIASWLGYTPANANGTINQVAKFTGATTLGNSSIFDNTTNVGINTISGFLGYTQITSANSTISPGGGGGAFTTTSQLMLASNSNSAIDTGGVISFGGKYNALQAYVGFGRIGGRKENATNGNIAGYLNFEVAENSNGGFLERMRISSLGNVGIATIAPTQKLHVVGRMILDNGQESSYIGTNSGIADLATTLTRNIGIGARTFQNSITGAKNVAIGVSALQASLGDDNVAIGFETLKANTVASNSALGYQALTTSTTAVENVAIGKFALREITTGGYNTALGYAAGRFISAGTSNALTTYSLFLGHSTRPLNSSDTNTIVIGASAIGIGPNTAVLGNDSIITTALKGNVGIGTTTPQANLEVYSTTAIPTIRLAYTPVSGYGGGGNIDFVGGSSDYVSGAISWKNGATTRGKINYDGVSDAMTISSESETIFINNGGEKVRINGLGDVGIGTSSPVAKVQIVGELAMTTNNSNHGWAQITTVTDTQPYEGTLIFKSQTFDGSTYAITEKMRISANTGNIGINLTTPDEKLTVRGNIKTFNLPIEGSLSSFTNSDYANSFETIEPLIGITRATAQSIYNPYLEHNYTETVSPAGTLWNLDGWFDISDVKTRNYSTFYNCLNGNIGNNVIGAELIMWDVINNKYYKIKFNSWTQGGNGGGFSYDKTLIYFEEYNTTSGKITAKNSIDVVGKINYNGPIYLKGYENTTFANPTHNIWTTGYNNQNVLLGRGIVIDQYVGSPKKVAIVESIAIGRDIFNNYGGYTAKSNSDIYIGNYLSTSGSSQQNTAYNIGIGYNIFQGATTAQQNIAIGYGSLNSATSAYQNTAVGFQSGMYISMGLFNTAIGPNSLSSYLDCSYSVGIGYQSAVTGNYQNQIGGPSSTTYVYGTVQNRSDIRDKADIRDTELGLEFISKLRPVDYKWDIREDYIEPLPEILDTPENATEEEKLEIFNRNKELKEIWGKNNDLNLIKNDGTHKRNRYHHGLIAQEVKQTIDELGIDFGGFQDHTINEGKDVLSIGYDELIAPMIKAIQELKAEVEALKQQINK